MIRLLKIGFLKTGDVFIVDNCTIHLKGANEHIIVDALWHQHNILLLPLPPYTPELNPTKLVFNTMASRLKAKRSRVTSNTDDDFVCAIKEEFQSMDRNDVKLFFRHCGYRV